MVWCLEFWMKKCFPCFMIPWDDALSSLALVLYSDSTAVVAVAVATTTTTITHHYCLSLSEVFVTLHILPATHPNPTLYRFPLWPVLFEFALHVIFNFLFESNACNNNIIPTIPYHTTKWFCFVYINACDSEHWSLHWFTSTTLPFAHHHPVHMRNATGLRSKRTLTQR